MGGKVQRKRLRENTTDRIPGTGPAAGTVVAEIIVGANAAPPAWPDVTFA